METEFGVTLFDDQTTHDAGWACQWRGPESDVTRIADTGELSSGTVWMTNLGYDMTRLAGLDGSRFRRDSYLGQSLLRHWQEMGLAPDQFIINPESVWGGNFGTHTTMRAAFSAWLFRQVSFAANEMLPLTAPPLSDLARGFHDHLVPPSKYYYTSGKPPKPEVMDALFQADLTWQPVSRTARSIGGVIPFRVTPNRVAHTLQMLRIPWPVGRFKETGSLKILSNQSSDVIADWVRDHPTALIRVTIQRTDRSMEALINHGANLSKKSRQGYWLTAPDILRLLPFCSMRLHHGYVGEAMVTGADFLAGDNDNDSVIPDADTLLMRAGSLSFNIAFENLWRAVSRPPPDRREGGPASAFLRAADRMLLFQRVMDLNEMGYTIMGYGSGGITLQLPEDFDRAELARHLLALKMSVPLVKPGDISIDMATELSQQHSESEAHRHFNMALLLGDLDSIIKMDEALYCYRAEAG